MCQEVAHTQARTHARTHLFLPLQRGKTLKARPIGHPKNTSRPYLLRGFQVGLPMGGASGTNQWETRMILPKRIPPGHPPGKRKFIPAPRISAWNHPLKRDGVRCWAEGEKRTRCCLTVSRHAHGETLFEATLLAAVAVDADDGAVLVFQTPFVLNVLLNAATEKALEERRGQG